MLAYSTLGMGFEQRGPEPVPVPWIDTGSREAVARAYESAFTSPIPKLDWTGRHDSCEAGTSSSTFRTATITRVNYYRAMAGVSATVSEDPGLSVKAQQAAIMMSAEGKLSHTPTSDFGCYTETGGQAAANSNLYLGRNGPEAIDGYIEDPGDDNTDVGHRNTILHPPTRQMGVGDVDRSLHGYSANALWVFDQRVFDEGLPGRQAPMREPGRFMAWPPRGFVPKPLIHPRWSFTLAGADLSKAQVVMYDAANPDRRGEVPLTVVSRTGGAGHVPLPTVVWEPQIFPADDVDTDYLVVITGVEPEATVPGEPPLVAVEPVYTYTVRVMGDTPNGRLDVAEALSRIDLA
jgi:uncharacterized protein YkwD